MVDCWLYLVYGICMVVLDDSSISHYHYYPLWFYKIIPNLFELNEQLKHAKPLRRGPAQIAPIEGPTLILKNIARQIELDLTRWLLPIEDPLSASYQNSTHISLLFRQYSFPYAEKHIIKYNSEYERFITTTKLRDSVISHIGKEEEFNVLSEALKL